MGDSEGFVTHNKQRTQIFRQQFMRDSVLGLLLNLDEASANCGTMSLFLNGARIAPPQELPEVLKGKALFPTITWRNLTVHTNFGPTPLSSLPFRCRMFQDASEKDCNVKVYP